MSKPLCFVLMPFGVRPAPSGGSIDFDAVYEQIYRPAIEAAGLEPLRGDEDRAVGVIHRAIFEKLMLCEYAVADLSTANPNVFYELGLRHVARPASTVLLFARDRGGLPFDVAPLRAIPYALDAKGLPVQRDVTIAEVTKRLNEARDRRVDSPVYQLIVDLRPPDLAHLRTDMFRDRVELEETARRKLRQARTEGLAAVQTAAAALNLGEDSPSGTFVDLLLSYRAVKGWKDMVALVETMPEPLRRTVLVREQLAFAWNRLGGSEQAEQVLKSLIDERGPNSETCGLLGRVYKDRWEAARTAGDDALASGWLDRAIATYLAGFESDWRDAYPGVNAVTLMTLREPPDPRALALLPVVAYAVERRIATGQPDYWDHATRLELAILANDANAARDAHAKAIACIRERWEPETTARNLKLIREARERRGAPEAWAVDLEQDLALRGKQG